MFVIKGSRGDTFDKQYFAHYVLRISFNIVKAVELSRNKNRMSNEEGITLTNLLAPLF